MDKPTMGQQVSWFIRRERLIVDAWDALAAARRYLPPERVGEIAETIARLELLTRSFAEVQPSGSAVDSHPRRVEELARPRWLSSN